MTTLNDLVNQISNTDEKLEWASIESEIIGEIQNLWFKADLYKDDLYILILRNIISNDEGDIRPLSPFEKDEFYNTSTISALDNYRTFGWYSIWFNLDRNFIKVYLTDEADITKSARENYMISWTRIKPEEGKSDHPYIWETLIDSTSSHWTDWLNLKKVVIAARKNNLGNNDLRRRLTIDRQKYFEDLHADIKENESETGITFITLPQAHNQVPLRLNTLNVIRGLSLTTTFFAEQNIIDFRAEAVAAHGTDTLPEYSSDIDEYINGIARTNLLDYYFQVMDYLNSISHETNYRFTAVVKVDQTYLWETGEIQNIEGEEEEGEFIPSPVDGGNNRYVFKICKVNDKPIVEAEIWENGSVYRITNHKSRVATGNTLLG